MRDIHNRRSATAGEYGAPADSVFGANIAGLVRGAEATHRLGLV